VCWRLWSSVDDEGKVVYIISGGQILGIYTLLLLMSLIYSRVYLFWNWKRLYIITET